MVYPTFDIRSITSPATNLIHVKLAIVMDWESIRCTPILYMRLILSMPELKLNLLRWVKLFQMTTTHLSLLIGLVGGRLIVAVRVRFLNIYAQVLSQGRWLTRRTPAHNLISNPLQGRTLLTPREWLVAKSRVILGLLRVFSLPKMRMRMIASSRVLMLLRSHTLRFALNLVTSQRWTPCAKTTLVLLYLIVCYLGKHAWWGGGGLSWRVLAGISTRIQPLPPILLNIHWCVRARVASALKTSILLIMLHFCVVRVIFHWRLG